MEGVKPALFGDPLGNGGDYTTGMYYKGRRKFLYRNDDEDDDSSVNSMMPPNEMMTNKQVFLIFEYCFLPVIQSLFCRKRMQKKSLAQKELNFFNVLNLRGMQTQKQKLFTSNCSKPIDPEQRL